MKYQDETLKKYNVVIYLKYFIAWHFYILGAAKFADAIELMTGNKIPMWFVLCWKFLSPAVTLVS